ncbi:phage terminase large subunit family protein [Rubellicoccus peritrichatus]|uniref:Phage terminase large subunit family protein n=1 Tax=Rubellicoccus peritrichatus TaxID=3080537 RepID=A0AAQ3LEK9_9BACT|nr:phage terminase large subunit family protein [Puniceicoccus sp. CR14]WOO43149.1 phage terminase large subunit family protein [Puniceicoccus sp. CR14]
MITEAESDIEFLEREFWQGVPRPQRMPVSKWAEKHFKAVGSPLSSDFRLTFTPWLREPLDWLDDLSIHEITFVGPAQDTGKSAFGEIALCNWIANRDGGDVQYNWETDVKTKARYKKRVQKVLKACGPVAKLWPRGLSRHDATNGLVIFPHLNFSMQGVETPGNLESDTIAMQVNEEPHAWEAGRMNLAEQRQKRVWNWFRLNLSTGGVVEDQLHRKFFNGTVQYWEEQCPSCKKRFVPQVRIKEGELGGIHYDSKKAKRADGSYDYNIIESTLYLECGQCGHRMHDDAVERQQRASKARWGKPTNPDADLWHRSIRLTGAATPNRPWVALVKRKHEALRALRYGDIEEYKNYIQRDEADFWDPRDRPLAPEVITISSNVTKNREGLLDRAVRIMKVDFQEGEAAKGEVPHFKAVIRDFRSNLDSQLVYEGMIDLPEDIEQLREEFEVEPRFVSVDSGHRARYIYQICARYGYNALKGEDKPKLYIHERPDESKTYRIYSPMQDVDPYSGDREGKEGLYAVPLIRYDKQSIRDLLDLIRAQTEWVVPGDVSDAYRKEMASEERREFIHPKTEETFWLWCKVTSHMDNDYYVCECYIAMFVMILIDSGYLEVDFSFEPSERPTDLKIEKSGGN